MCDEDIRDPRKLTFSQAYGYEELPQPLKLEEVPEGVRTKLWNLLYGFAAPHPGLGDMYPLGSWYEIIHSIYFEYYELALDEYDFTIMGLYKLKGHIMDDKFNKLFDLLLTIMRHPGCPQNFIHQVATVFHENGLAYVVDENDPVTIYPAATREEGKIILRSIAELKNAKLEGSVTHLRQASDCINRGDHAGAVRECIHAVESTARQLDPTARTLEPALKSLEKERGLHPALKQAFSKLYGYTSDEQGIRHALIDNQQSNVGQDEALFMLGACASFSSYLTRKHRHQTS